MDKDRALYLVQQYRNHEIEESELEELRKWMRERADSDMITDAIEEDILLSGHAEIVSSELLEKMFGKVMSADKPSVEAPVRRMWMKWVAAAVVVLMIVGGWWWIRESSIVKRESNTVAKGNDVPAPSGTRAMITLADGSTIYLDSVGGGTLAVQNDVQVMKTAEGKVVYTGATTGNGEIVYNTLFNPRGSKVIDMQLSDGSHVWLNAGSSIRYPVAFIGKERVVEINGEAYFEVARLERSNAKNAKQAQRTQSENMPFIVKKGDVSVTVLGTHFNVNAYDDEESLKVTLLEGSVAVKRASTMVKLTPGQQAIAASGKLQVASSVDVDEVMAWKNGKFVFNKTNVQTTMRQIARWYDVDIEYKDNVKGFFSGGISRLENASQVLKMLEMTGEVHFAIDGKKVMVMK